MMSWKSFRKKLNKISIFHILKGCRKGEHYHKIQIVKNSQANLLVKQTF